MSGARSWGRRGLLALLFVLTCLAATLSVVAVWAHQTVLGTDRFVATVERVVQEPEVQAFAADRLARQVVEAADVEGRIAGVLPSNQAFLAVPIASAVERVLDERLTDLFARPRAQEALVTAAGATHRRLMTVLRGDSDVVTVEGTTVTIDLLPIAVEGLAQLQQLGLIPATVTLPDVSDPASRDAAIASLEERLGRDIPDDFALVTVADATRLATAQQLVRAFDLVVIVLVVVTLILAVLTIAFAQRRLRMVIALALGVVVALVLARIIARTVMSGVASSAAAGGSGDVLRLVVQDLTQDLATWTWLLVGLGIVVALAVWALSRPDWLTSGTEALASASRSERSAAWLRDHADGVGWSAAIVLVVAALAVVATPELAILAGIGLAVIAWSGVLRRGSATDAAAPAGDAAVPTADAPAPTADGPAPPTG
jgi:hypothetical protein